MGVVRRDVLDMGAAPLRAHRRDRGTAVRGDRDRHFARIVAIAAPPSAAIAIFLPAPTNISVLTAVVTGGCALLLTALWVNEGTEHRLVQAGWPWDSGPAIRDRRATVAQRMASAARRQQIIERRRPRR